MVSNATQGRRRRRAGTPIRIALVAAWLLTIAVLARVETRRREHSPDVQALLEAARLEQRHASARYEIRSGGEPVGSLSSTVSGEQREQQLVYALRGELTSPVTARLQGFVLAGWDRRPERLLLDLRLGGLRHRVEGALRRTEPGGAELFEARYVPPQGGEAVTWVLPDVPRLAPGPLPLPEVSVDDAGAPPGSTSGAVADPVTGEPVEWSLTRAGTEELEIAGVRRQVMRHELRYGPFVASAWIEPTGFPVRVELPFDVSLLLVEESR